MKKLEIMEWSLNLSSSTSAKIPEWVFEAMKIQREETKGRTLPDIIFLNEVVTCNDSCSRLLKKLEMENYRVICSNNNHGNQVAIALNSDFKIKNIVYQLPYIQAYYAPDFLHVEAEYNKKLYNLVALRIRISSNKLTDEEFIHRNIQFQGYKNYISKLSNVISAGDFNHARIIGSEDESYNKSQDLYERGKFFQRFYNYQMIRNEIYYERIQELGMFTPLDDISSVGIWNKNKEKFEIPYIGENNNRKYDHIVLSNKIIAEKINCRYDWDFYRNLTKKYVNLGTGLLNKGIPDHAQLRASITIK